MTAAQGYSGVIFLPDGSDFIRKPLVHVKVLLMMKTKKIANGNKAHLLGSGTLWFTKII